MAGMRIVVAGAGALGTCYATLLAAAGAEVCVLTRPERAPALSAGLRVSGLLRAQAQVEVVTRGPAAGRADYVLVATKTRDTPAALAALAGIGAGAVFSLQNGVTKDDALAAAFGRERVIGDVHAAVGAEGDAARVHQLRAQRRSRVADLAGDVLRQARAHGVPVPVTETCYRLLRGLEDGFAG